VLFGSAALAALKSEPWITPTHALAYCLMFVGGVLPACGGHLAALFRPAFWRQPFVASAILAELALGMHDLMLSGCAYHADVVRNGGSSSPADAIIDGQAEVEPLSDDSYEYFIWSRVSFIATFAGMYSLSPRLWGQLVELFNGLVAPRYVYLPPYRPRDWRLYLVALSLTRLSLSPPSAPPNTFPCRPHGVAPSLLRPCPPPAGTFP
jgi:hypothetical protein